MNKETYLQFSKMLLKNRFLKRNPIPYKYVFLLTNLCQSRCNTCFIWKIYIDNPNLLKEELNLEEYKKIFQSIKEYAFWINFSGGEPFLRKDLEDIIVSSAETIDTLRLINMPTNGLAPTVIERRTRKILERLPKKINFDITVSLDSIKREKYKEIRGVDSVDKVIDSYNRLKELTKEFKNLSVNIQMTVSKFNLDDWETIKYVIDNCEMPIFAFAHENKYFNNVGTDILMAKNLNQKFFETINFIEKNYKAKSLKSLVPKIFLKLAKKFFENPFKQVVSCDSLKSTITIDPYGYLLPCSYFYVKMANIRELNYNLIEFFEKYKDKVEEIRREIKENRCPVCWANCEAYPTIFAHPIETLSKLLF